MDEACDALSRFGSFLFEIITIKQQEVLKCQQVTKLEFMILHVNWA